MWEFWRSKRSTKRLNDGRASPQQVETPTSLARIASTTVNFKDLNLGPDFHDFADNVVDGNPADDDDEDTLSEDSTNKFAILTKKPRKVPERTKYVIILVGLPGRGKTFLCNKLKCYLNWLGHNTRHINVGSYRRQQKAQDQVQTADFFDAHNPAGLEARNKALQAALDDLMAYLYSPEGQVAIFDATNTTEERRQQLISAFHGKFQYLFIESICTDQKVLEQNYRFKMQYSPDYQGMDTDQALSDFKARILKYEEVYETISNRNIHYIKLIDMVTGRGHMDVNRISGYLPGKIVFFLMQVCKAGMAQARKIWLTRHGESEFNQSGRIGGDSGLAPSGEEYAQALPDIIVDRLPLSFDHQHSIPVSVWTSTLRRTIQTARYLPFPKLRWKALDEIHAGACDGLTYREIEERFPEEYAARGKDKLRYRYPAGESYLDVIQRLEPVVIEMEREKECIIVVAHQAVLRAIFGYFTAIPLEKVPTLEIPLHTVVELRPRSDGTMDLEYLAMPEHVPIPPSGSSWGQSPGPSPLGMAAAVNAAVAMRRSNPGNTAFAPSAEPEATLPQPQQLEIAAPRAQHAAICSVASLSGGLSQELVAAELLQVQMAAAGQSSSAPAHSRGVSFEANLHGGISPGSAASPQGQGGLAGEVSLGSSPALSLLTAKNLVPLRPVRVPYGATPGGGGSEGGAAPFEDDGTAAASFSFGGGLDAQATASPSAAAPAMQVSPPRPSPLQPPRVEVAVVVDTALVDADADAAASAIIGDAMAGGGPTEALPAAFGSEMEGALK